MSQVDKLNYVPLLIWFVLLMVILYMIVFVHFIPLAFSIVSVRTKFLTILVGEGYGIIVMLLQLISFSTRVSVPAISAVNMSILAGLPSLLYTYLIVK